MSSLSSNIKDNYKTVCCANGRYDYENAEFNDKKSPPKTIVFKLRSLDLRVPVHLWYNYDYVKARDKQSKSD